MSEVIEDTSIDHLDFDFDEDNLHYAHPTDTSLRWCGEKALRLYKYDDQKVTNPKNIGCAECVRLAKTVNWWFIHRKHFGSTCIPYPHHHNCGA